MTRHFSLRKMLRMTPNRLLQDVFLRLECRLLCIDWRKMPERCDAALLIALDLLSPESRTKIEQSLAAIHELASPGGVQAILEGARQLSRDRFVSLLPEAGPYHIAAWTWLHFPEVFERASLMQGVDRLTRWRKRKGLPRIEPRRTPEALAELAQGISRFLKCEEGRGQRCTVEHYRRDNGTDYRLTSRPASRPDL